jgi:hypothetical protein
MKIKSALITQASGSIGGLTASHNRGGQYFRARTVPVQPVSNYREAVKGALSSLAAIWQSVLTKAQRAAWDLYAASVPLTDRLGDARYATGLNHYLRSNVPRIQAGSPLARVDDGPTEFLLPLLTPLTFTADVSDGELSVAFTNTDEWATAVGGALLLYVSPPRGPSINYFKGPYRYAGRILGAAEAPVSPQKVNLPFPVTTGDRVFIRARAITADGRLSAPFRGSTDTVE